MSNQLMSNQLNCEKLHNIRIATPVRGDAEFTRSKIEGLFGHCDIVSQGKATIFQIPSRTCEEQRVIESGKIEDYLFDPNPNINNDEKPFTTFDYILSGILGFYPPIRQPLVEHERLEVSHSEFAILKAIFAGSSPSKDDTGIRNLERLGLISLAGRYPELTTRGRRILKPYIRFEHLFETENGPRDYGAKDSSANLLSAKNNVIENLNESSFSVGKWSDKESYSRAKVSIDGDFGFVEVYSDGSIAFVPGWASDYKMQYTGNEPLVSFLESCFEVED